MGIATLLPSAIAIASDDKVGWRAGEDAAGTISAADNLSAAAHSFAICMTRKRLQFAKKGRNLDSPQKSECAFELFFVFF